MRDEIKDRFIVSNSKWAIKDLIHHICNSKVKYFWWLTPGKNDRQAKDMICSILDKLSKEEDEEVVVQNINRICSVLKNRPYRLISVITLVYRILTGGGEKNGLENFVKSVIIVEKERVSDYVIELLSFDEGCTINNLNRWRHILKHESVPDRFKICARC